MDWSFFQQGAMDIKDLSFPRSSEEAKAKQWAFHHEMEIEKDKQQTLGGEPYFLIVLLKEFV